MNTRNIAETPQLNADPFYFRNSIHSFTLNVPIIALSMEKECDECLPISAIVHEKDQC